MLHRRGEGNRRIITVVFLSCKSILTSAETGGQIPSLQDKESNVPGFRIVVVSLDLRT
jgi:hypothetical protein